MTTPFVRVLLVDDFGPWRRFASSMLQTKTELRVVGEALDGLEAVQKAQDLQPDLILLDICLPALNGIEAARRIREKVPKAKILFLSETRSSEITEEALLIGAAGYVLKSDGVKELLPAVEAILAGNQYISSSLAKDASKQHVPANSGFTRLLAPLPPQNPQFRHEVEFYQHDAALVDGFARLIEAILAAGNRVIVLATEVHWAQILGRLRADSVDLDAAAAESRYIAMDVAEVLAAVMVNDIPDAGRCARLVGDLIDKTAKGASSNQSPVTICGECASTLLSRGNEQGAIRLEQLWNQITRKSVINTLCGYVCNTFQPMENSPAFQRICAEHTAVQGRALGYKR